MLSTPPFDDAQAAEPRKKRTAALKALIEKLTRIMGELRDEGVSRLALIELEHKIAMLDAERKWVSNLEKEIVDGRLEWKVGIDPDNAKLRRSHGSPTPQPPACSAWSDPRMFHYSS